jgi:hypothetical protein
MTPLVIYRSDRLQVVEVSVKTALLRKARIRALLHKAAFIYDHDLVGLDISREPVRDGDNHPSLQPALPTSGRAIGRYWRWPPVTPAKQFDLDNPLPMQRIGPLPRCGASARVVRVIGTAC